MQDAVCRKILPVSLLTFLDYVLRHVGPSGGLGPGPDVSYLFFCFFSPLGVLRKLPLNALELLASAAGTSSAGLNGSGGGSTPAQRIFLSLWSTTSAPHGASAPSGCVGCCVHVCDRGRRGHGSVSPSASPRTLHNACLNTSAP
ncbi:hypothetical protein GY45DRAFT_46850 [Cubamyces sp. BRFM 1775]|nr:hypothetical protein GY45DRAFT_46850 [Cubamyces sp. BRFM 1775]